MEEPIVAVHVVEKYVGDAKRDTGLNEQSVRQYTKVGLDKWKLTAPSPLETVHLREYVSRMTVFRHIDEHTGEIEVEEGVDGVVIKLITGEHRR